MAERGKTSTEIIQIDFDSPLAKPFKDDMRLVLVADQDRFGHFDMKQALQAVKLR